MPARKIPEIIMGVRSAMNNLLGMTLFKVQANNPVAEKAAKL